MEHRVYCATVYAFTAVHVNFLFFWKYGSTPFGDRYPKFRESCLDTSEANTMSQKNGDLVRCTPATDVQVVWAIIWTE